MGRCECDDLDSEKIEFSHYTCGLVHRRVQSIIRKHKVEGIFGGTEEGFTRGREAKKQHNKDDGRLPPARHFCDNGQSTNKCRV